MWLKSQAAQKSANTLGELEEGGQVPMGSNLSLILFSVKLFVTAASILHRMLQNPRLTFLRFLKILLLQEQPDKPPIPHCSANNWFNQFPRERPVGNLRAGQRATMSATGVAIAVFIASVCFSLCSCRGCSSDTHLSPAKAGSFAWVAADHSQEEHELICINIWMLKAKMVQSASSLGRSNAEHQQLNSTKGNDDSKPLLR